MGYKHIPLMRVVLTGSTCDIMLCSNLPWSWVCMFDSWALQMHRIGTPVDGFWGSHSRPSISCSQNPWKWNEVKRSVLQHGRSKTQDQNFCQGAFEHVTLAMSGWSSTFPSSFLIQHVWFLRHPRHRIFEASDLRFYQILSDVIPLRLFHPVSSQAL